MPFKIVLLGSVPKGDKERESWPDWKSEYKQAFSIIPDTEFADGDEWRRENLPFETVGHDSFIIKSADAVVVNAQVKLGAGTAQEMVIAKYFSRPLVAVLPKDTHHRRSNVVFEGENIKDWIHPFILNFSDVVCQNLEEAAEWLKDYQANPAGKSIKDITIIDQAIAAYQQTLVELQPTEVGSPLIMIRVGRISRRIF